MTVEIKSVSRFGPIAEALNENAMDVYHGKYEKVAHLVAAADPLTAVASEMAEIIQGLLDDSPHELDECDSPDVCPNIRGVAILAAYRKLMEGGS